MTFQTGSRHTNQSPSLGRGIRSLLVVAILGTVPVACTGTQLTNKSGAPVHGTVELTLQMPEAGDAQGEFFANAVEHRSGGSIHVTIDQVTYSSSEPANEARLAQALQTGRADIGYLPARAWSERPTFRALLAPFALTTTAAEQTLATDPLAAEILAGLPPSVVGLGLIPAEPRRVLATRPPDSLSAFSRLRVRIVDNPQSALDFRALGARPVQGISGDEVNVELQGHQIDAAETSPTFALDNGYYRLAHYLSAYAIFPKFHSIVLSRSTWTGLSQDQRSAVQRAVADTLAQAARKVPVQEEHALQQLCDLDVVVTVPRAGQLESLYEAARVVDQRISSDPAAANVLAAIQSLPGAGPKAAASPVPEACSTRSEPPPPSAGSGPATIPNGVYVVTMTADDLRAGGLVGPKFDHALTETTRFKDGYWSQVETPPYPGQGPWAGPYVVDGDQVTLSYLEPTVNDSPPDVLRWSYFDGILRFEVVDVSDPAARVMYAAHPWRKVR